MPIQRLLGGGEPCRNRQPGLEHLPVGHLVVQERLCAPSVDPGLHLGGEAGEAERIAVVGHHEPEGSALPGREVSVSPLIERDTVVVHAQIARRRSQIPRPAVLHSLPGIRVSEVRGPGRGDRRRCEWERRHDPGEASLLDALRAIDEDGFVLRPRLERGARPALPEVQVLHGECGHAGDERGACVLYGQHHGGARSSQSPGRPDVRRDLEVAEVLHHRHDVGAGQPAGHLFVDGQVGQPALVTVGAQPEVGIEHQVARGHDFGEVVRPHRLACRVPSGLLGREQVVPPVMSPRLGEVDHDRTPAVARRQVPKAPVGLGGGGARRAEEANKEQGEAHRRRVVHSWEGPTDHGAGSAC